MNIVEVLKSQLAGEVSKKLGGMVGASESDLTKIMSVGLPSVLSGLGALASSKSGADKLADALGKMDSSGFGDLGKMLEGGALSSAGGLLEGLLGGNAIEGIATAISKYTGIHVSIVKKAIEYLIPLVLGSIGSSFKGGKIDGAGIAKLFSDQKGNIAASMPSGFSLENIPGFQSLASNVSGNIASMPSLPTTSDSGGIGKLLVPLILVGALVAGLVYFLNIQPKGNPAGQATPPAEGYAAQMAEGAKKALVGEVDSMKSGLTSMMEGLITKLDSVKDAAGANDLLPELQESVKKIEGMTTGFSALPADGKVFIAGLIKTQLEKLNPLIDKISTLPGLGDVVKQALNQLKEKLTAFLA